MNHDDYINITNFIWGVGNKELLMQDKDITKTDGKEEDA